MRPRPRLPPPSRTEPLAGLAPAKVNLTLRVTGRRPDGYHLLDSLVVFAGVGDRLTVTPSDELSLAVMGPLAAGVPTGTGNLVLRAADLLRERRSVRAGAAILLEKHLPHGGGIGGGSSDAACALRLLARLWGVPPLERSEALALGADLPVCLHAPAPARMTGIGEGVDPVPPLPGAALVLVSPGLHASTPAVFGAHAQLRTTFSEAQDPPPEGLDPAGLARFAREGGNDLAPAAIRVAPGIGAVLDALSATPGLLGCGMSGSGSVCWGLAADAVTASQAAATLERPGWWVRAAPLLS